MEIFYVRLLVRFFDHLGLVLWYFCVGRFFRYLLGLVGVFVVDTLFYLYSGVRRFLVEIFYVEFDLRYLHYLGRLLRDYFVAYDRSVVFFFS